VRQIIEVEGDRPYGETVTSIEAPGAVVGGVGGYRGPLRAPLSGPHKECPDELSADAAAAMGWIDVNALQVGHPDRTHTARSAEAPGQVTRHLIAVAREQDQVLAVSERDVQYAMPVSAAQPRSVAVVSCNPASAATSASTEARKSGISSAVAAPIRIVTRQHYPDAESGRVPSISCCCHPALSRAYSTTPNSSPSIG
jgi:hypothetical protein